MEKAFDPGYDPALEIASHAKRQGHNYSADDPDGEHLRRQEQDFVDRIISGEEKGRYYMFLGPKVLDFRLKLSVTEAYRTSGCREDNHDL